MQVNRRHYSYISMLVLAVVGSAGASMQLSQPAIASETVRQCMQDLIDDGISEANAAIACRGRRNRDWGNYRNRNRYLELRARSGPTPEGRWRYSAPGVPYDAMRRAGCENVRGDDWRCPTPRLRVYVQNHHGSYMQFPQPPQPPAIFPF
ncbi:hypothetical protein NIES4101_25610 (plasmid) [Calothrix sp. NIES-4101]|nr:hypothetical protein NIES4101_25610 [Calothrix sp. NIES-4101]